MDRLHWWRCPLIKNNSYTRTSKKIPRTKEEIKQFYCDRYSYYKNLVINEIEKTPLSLLLDSSLITATQNKKYTIKVIQCGDYYQVYRYNNVRLRKDKTQEKIINTKNKEYIYTDMLISPKNYQNKPSRGVVEQKNIDRSKFQLQRLIKANEKEFKTFITLTFAENISDIKKANDKFRSWRTKIKSIYKDFRYVCVPEFQKRGAVHYHLLTNLEIDEYYHYTRRSKKTKAKLIVPQEGTKSQYDVKYWPNGFTSVFSMNNINVIGYLSKYMTKDIDNRLFGHRRYFYSNNLIKPNEIYIDLSNDSEFNLIADIMSNCNIAYEKTYLDMFGEVVDFVEYKSVIGENSPRANNGLKKSHNIYYVNLLVYN